MDKIAKAEMTKIKERLIVGFGGGKWQRRVSGSKRTAHYFGKNPGTGGKSSGGEDPFGGKKGEAAIGGTRLKGQKDIFYPNLGGDQGSRGLEEKKEDCSYWTLAFRLALHLRKRILVCKKKGEKK